MCIRDRITAAISHCPHLISASLINTVANEDSDGSYARLAAGGLKDVYKRQMKWILKVDSIK